MTEQNDLQVKPKIGWKNHIWWIILVMVFWYLLVFSELGMVLFDDPLYILEPLIKHTGDMADSMRFVVWMYLSTITSFIGVFVSEAFSLQRPATVSACCYGAYCSAFS